LLILISPVGLLGGCPIIVEFRIAHFRFDFPRVCRLPCGGLGFFGVPLQSWHHFAVIDVFGIWSSLMALLVLPFS